jgi:ATP-dependent exoDNAse (exonuclease V) beta subunit
LSKNKFTIQKSFAISAGAGSGKTYTLSRRYINALLGFDYFREDYKTQESFFDNLKAAKVNQIVTITYTEAAALEMKGRIFELVKKIINLDTLEVQDGDYSSIIEANSQITTEQQKYVKDTLLYAYTESTNSKISTIHAYCLTIIKANSDIARIDVKLDIIKEDEKANELSKIVFDVLNSAENEAKVLDIATDISIFFVNNLIQKYVSSSKFRKDYDSFDETSIDIDMYKKIIEELYPLPDTNEDFEIVKAYMLENQMENAQKYSEVLESYIHGVVNFEAKYLGSLLSEHELSIAFNRKPFNSHKAIKENIENIKTLEGFISIYSKIDTQKEALFFDKIKKIKTILHEIKSRYDARLTELGKIDFDTIISKTLEIIPHANTSFKYIMVDEFQDTNETQFAIVRSSMSEDTNLFVVGDSKQSIYSFQGAEIEVFNNAVEDKSLFSSIELMSTNHRSDGVVLEYVNKIFNALLQKNTHLKLISQNYEATPQELEVFKKERQVKGSFKFLVTAQAYKEDANELDTIVSFIDEVCSENLPEYKHISKRIKEKKKAIAIIFDSSTKMLELKLKLREKGITAKVSASDNFYHTKEVNDVFNTLKAVYILSKKPEELSASQKYFVVAAMRSNILRVDDDTIKKHLDNGTLPDQLSHLVERYFHMPLSEFVKYMYDSSNLFGVYAHLNDVEQRVANLYKFLALCKEYQNSNESNLYKFLSLLENSIYFSEAKEDEAFFKSDNTKSIEICSIHSTKGLAYPLVLLGNSDKGLYSQITSDGLKHNNFTLCGEKKEIVGFKINSYEPVSLRVLKEMDKLKHLAEKKRLLYVALTRAEHDVVISALLKATSGGGISLREDSYLAMMCNALSITKEQLFEQDAEHCIGHVEFQKREPIEQKAVGYSEHILEELAFEAKEFLSATSHAETHNETAAALGTITHKIIELYWESLEHMQHEKIFDKFEIYEESEQQKLKNSIAKFLESELYTKLKSGVEHKFELEFHMPNKRGFIDLVYFDVEKNGWVIVDFKTGQQTKEKEQGYQAQLAFYESVLVESGMSVVGKGLLWV